MKPSSFATTCTRARAPVTSGDTSSGHSSTCSACCRTLLCFFLAIYIYNGRPREAAGSRPNLPAPIPAARGRLLLPRRAGRRPLQPRRRPGRGGRVRALRLLQGRQPRRASGRRGPAGGRGRQVLRVAAGGQGRVRVRPRQPARVREQAHRAQWRHGVARVPPPRPRRQRLGVQGLPCPVILAAGRGEPVRGLREGPGDVGAGGGGGGARRGAEGRAERHGGGRGERPGVPDQPLPCVPAAAAPAGLVRRHRLRRAHGPAAGVRAALQRHARPAAGAPRRRRALGARASRPRRLLRHRRRLAAGPDEWEAEKCAAPGGGQQPEAAGVHDLLRGTGAGAADRAIAAAAGARQAEPVQGLHMGRLQEGCLPLAARRQPPGPLPHLVTRNLSRAGRFVRADASLCHRPAPTPLLWCVPPALRRSLEATSTDCFTDQ
uniref:Uncharacterized protein n=1 Tax=Zea mays TaxID=4577 RepID=A0A804Q4R9_MAIZE